MTTLDNSQQSDWLQTELESMSLQEGSPAKTSQPQGDKQALMASEVDCGVKSPVLLASYNPDTRSWKTSQTSLVATGDDGLDEFLETWPRSGMTRNGIAYQLPRLAPTITEIGSGYWPTPTANEDAAGTPKGKMQAMLGNHPSLRGNTPEEWARGTLNPVWVEWLMGFPIGHTDLNA